jgi:uncharacterized protein (TIGR02001 family)
MTAPEKLLISSFLLGASVTHSLASDIAVTITPSVVSQYMFRGVHLGGAALQPSVDFTSGNLSGGVWVSTFLSNKVSGESDPEIDSYASYTIVVNDKFSVVPGFSYYTYPDADESSGSYKSSFEPYLSAAYAAGALTLTPKVYYDTVLKGPTYELGAAFSIPLKRQKSSLDLSVLIGTYSWKETLKGSNPEVKNRGDYFQAGVSTPCKLTDKIAITFGLTYCRGFNNRYESTGSPSFDNTDAVGRIVASISCSSSF